ncbi:unnamed protein product [Closterium sp. NIES-54]
MIAYGPQTKHAELKFLDKTHHFHCSAGLLPHILHLHVLLFLLLIARCSPHHSSKRRALDLDEVPEVALSVIHH